MNPKACNDSKNVLEDKVIASRGYRRPFKVCSEPPLLLRPQWKWNWAVRNLPGSPPPSTNSSPLVTLITAITNRTLPVKSLLLCVHTKKSTNLSTTLWFIGRGFNYFLRLKRQCKTSNNFSKLNILSFVTSSKKV